jgi:glycosyltransferase involved in cell wall biosynthesis
MAVHNGRPFVEAGVRSILAQSFADFEFVIGDDGSDDGGSEDLRRLAAGDPRVRLLRRERSSGLAASANWVVGETRAPIVAIAHADDLSHPERLARQMAVLRDNPDAVLVGTLCEGIDEQARRVQPAAAWRLRSGAPFAPFPHTSIAFRRDAFDRVGGYRPEAEYWEDFDLYLRLAELGRVLVLTEELTSVRHTMGSTRLRDEDERVYAAIDTMYRVAEAYRRGVDHLTPFGRARGEGEKLHPLSFVSRGSIRLWSGRSPGVLRPMLRRARLRADLVSLQALVWAGWGEVSPASLRAFIRLLLKLRNRRVRSALAGREVVEWQPRGEPG